MKRNFTLVIFMLLAVGAVRAQDFSGQETGSETLKTYPVQFTLVTPLSTDQIINLDPEQTIHQFSINLLLGKNGGLSGASFSGIGSYLYNDMRGLQMSGLGSITQGAAEGVQMAGIANLGQSLRGLQMAGVANIVEENVLGAQFAGVSNIADSVRGSQFSGVFNLANGLQGGQFAGAVNLSLQQVRGAQFAGAVNISLDTLAGLQVAPINISQRGLKGHQLGVINIATNDVQGVQLGVINSARHVKGSMIGVINVAESIDGFNIGVLTAVRHGYRAVALEANEVFDAMVTYRMGSANFYNIYGISYRNYNDFNNYYRYGLTFGWGTQFHVSPKNHFFFELTATQVNENEAWTNSLNLISKFHMGMEVRLFRWAALSMGPSFNVLTSNVKYEDGLKLPSISRTNILNSQTHGDTNIQMWVGFQLGLRFGRFHILDRDRN